VSSIELAALTGKIQFVLRRIFNFASLLSLLLGLTTLVLWVLTYSWWPCEFSAVRDLFDGKTRDGQQVVELTACHGGARVLLYHQWHDGPRMNFLTQMRSPEWGVGFYHWDDAYPHPVNEIDVRMGFAGYVANDSSSNGVHREIELVAPFWGIALVTAALPAVWWGKFRGARRKKRGLCGRCGYDLTGNILVSGFPYLFGAGDPRMPVEQYVENNVDVEKNLHPPYFSSRCSLIQRFTSSNGTELVRASPSALDGVGPFRLPCFNVARTSVASEARCSGGHLETC